MRVVHWLAASLVLAAAAAAQSPPARPLFKSSIELTTVTATVVNADGQLVAALDRSAFDLFEDGERQTITHFSNQRVPVSLAVLLDVSDSMFGQRLKDARTAIEQFVGGLLDNGDEFAIVAFNHKQQVLAQWSSDAADDAAKAMTPIHPFGSTAIYDAIIAAMPLAASRHRQRAALLIISDGADTASDASPRDVRSELLRSDVFVYAVAIDAPDRRPINAPINPSALADITDQSGGRTKVVRSSGDLSAALAGIADELNHQYLLGYSSTHGDDGKYHAIRLRVRGTSDKVRARNGYVAERK